jgi:hypothetical protein
MPRRADWTGWEPALNRSRWTATLLLLLFLPNCVGWHAENVTPPAVVMQRGPSEVRVRRTDGSRVTLSQPRLHGDTLYGQAGSAQHWVGIPLTGIAGIETHHTDPFKTTLAVLALGAVAAVIVAGIQLANDPFFSR